MVPAPFPLTLYRGATFGPLVITALQEDQVTPVDLTGGWLVYAKVRKTPTGPVLIDLAPTVTNGAIGEITIPAIPDETTEDSPGGNFVWDLLLERPTGEVVGPFLAGAFVVTTAVSRV